MIIQCEQCKTKFRLDDARVTDKGVKVRCAKCRNIFTVEKPKSESAPQADFASLLDQKSTEDESAFKDSAATTGAAEEAATPQASGTDSFSENNPFVDATVPNVPAETEESEPSVKVPQTVPETDDTAGLGFGADDPFAATAPETPVTGETPPEPVPAVDDDTNFAGFDFDSSDPFADAATTAPAAEQARPETAPAAADDGFAGFDFDSSDPFADAATTAPAAEQARPETAPPTADDSFAGFDFDSSDPFADAATTAPAAEQARPETAPATADDSFSGFDFDSSDPFADAATTAPAPEQAQPEPVPAVDDDTNFAGFDFDSDDPFGDAATTTPSAEEARPGTVPAADDDTNFADFDFDSSNPFADQEKVAQGEPDFSAALPEPKPEADFSSFSFETDLPREEGTASKEEFGKQEDFSSDRTPKTDDFFDFNELKAPQPEPTRITADEPGERGVADSATVPLSETPVADGRPAQPAVEPRPSFGGIPASPVVSQEELPPLSISSRRKQSSLITGAIAVIGVLGASAAAFFGYSYFAQDKVKSVTDTEKIIIRTVEASFIKNSSAGELLVISGEAQNNFKKPRAAIQIKGMVYGPGGQVVASKNAYAGNQLTREQLATMPLDKIEAAMANQFGDSLSNLGVPPAKTIPFVIVIPTPPADAKDYGVEAAGSTVATGKQ